MKNKKLYLALILITLVFVLAACGMFNNDNQNTRATNNVSAPSESNTSNEGENESADGDDESHEESPYGWGYDDEIDGGADGNVLPLIEIFEDRIIFGGNDVSLVELEEILIEHGGTGHTWELRDAHRAVKSVYDAVVELLNRHGIPFSER